MQHLDEGTIHAWLDGELTPDEAARAAQHAAECAECGALVAEARGVLAGASRIVSALDAGPSGVVPPAQRATQPKRRSWYRFALTPARMSIAATLLVAAGVTLTVQHSRVGGDGASPATTIDSRSTVPALAPPAGIADSIATVTAAPRAAKTLAAEGATAQKPRNNAPPVVAPTSDAPAAGLVGGVGGTPVGNKKATSELKARDAVDFDKAASHSPVVAEARAPAAAPAPVPAAAAARLDSVRAKDEAAKAAVATDRALQLAPERRQVAGANQVAQSMMTAEREASSTNATSSQDCYRLDIDSTAWRGALPSTFALGPAVSGNAAGVGARRAAVGGTPTMSALLVTPLNAVHAVTASGRVDSLIVGDWRQAGPSLVTVRFSPVAQRKQVRLFLPANSSMAQLISTDGIIDSVRVARMNCVR